MVNEILQKISMRFSRTWHWATLGVIGAMVIGVVGYRQLWLQPKVVFPTGPALGVTEVSNTKPVVIKFNRPVKKKTLHYAIHPDLPGRWNLVSTLLSGQSKLTFTPTESPDLDTRYTVELTGISSMLGRQQENYLLSFQTGAIPTISSFSPTINTVDVLPDTPIILNFDKAVSDGVAVSVSMLPEVVFAPSVISGKTVTFTHQAPLEKSTTYTLKAFLGKVKIDYTTKKTTVSEDQQEIISANITTIAAPGVQTYTPTGSGVDSGTAIRVVFKQAMEHTSTEAAFSLSPAAAGAFTWENDQTLVFTPKPSLTKAQAYTATLANTAKAASGFTLDENLSWSFTVIGAVGVSSSSPASGASGVDPATTVSVVFNQEVVAASAESKFSISPTVSGSFTWSGNTMVFHSQAALSYGTAYTVTVGQGVQTVKGLDSASAWSAKFTTRNQSVMLNVPSYLQAHMYSCMIAAARDALAFRGVAASESAIISRVGRDTTPWSGTWGQDGAVWGDPDAAMVGGLDNGAATSPAGKKTTNVYWGYGSHWGPISKALTSYGVANEVRSGMTVQNLAQAIADGNPIIIWWVNGIWPSYQVKWKTKSGKPITGVNGLHVQVVRGFTGSVTNPISFTLTDSGYGYPGRTIDIGTFKAKWKWFGNTGIIVK